MVDRAQLYADAIFSKSQGINGAVGFNDGTVLVTTRAKDHSLVGVVYNGHKRKMG